MTNGISWVPIATAPPLLLLPTYRRTLVASHPVVGLDSPVRWPAARCSRMRSEEHTSELQSRGHLVCRLLLEKKKTFLFSSVCVDFARCVLRPLLLRVV